MERELVSVIMSIYNESEIELRKSIDSILTQTYKNIEFIIVNDNPSRDINRKVLSRINCDKVKVFHNDKNVGLVNSLNLAFSKTSGKYIARMDADDISQNDRIEKQLEFLKVGGYDLVGSMIELIDENDDTLGEMIFPVTDKYIKKSLKYGGCVAHPSWLVKREVYDSLNGYRYVPHCEDYDFLYRTINHGFKLGNTPEKLLKYRVRKNSVSISNKSQQLILRRYLSKNNKNLDLISEADIQTYLLSDDYSKHMKQFMKYEEIKSGVRKHNFVSVLRLITCSDFYSYIIEKNIPRLYVYK